MSQLKTKFTVRSKFGAFYTRGKIQVSSDGVYMFCGCGNKVNVLEVETGKVFSTVGEKEDEKITSFCLTPDDKYIILATQRMLLRQWDWRKKELVRTWRAVHFAPVLTMTFDCTSTLLATGAADSTIKIWDIEKQYCTHNLCGHQGVISVVAFHPDISRLLLYSAGEDYKIRVWNLQNSACIKELEAHYSLVTCIDFSADGSKAFTAGRDGVVSILDTTSHEVKRTFPVYEVVESLLLLPDKVNYPAINVDRKSLHFITAGNKGYLRLWNSDTGKCVYTTDVVNSKHEITGDTSDVKNKAEDTENIIQMIYNKQKNTVTVVTYDQCISVLSLEKLRLQKQFSGYNDEILDVKYFGADDKFAVVATNSQHIKVFELSNCDCEILYGHTDIVMCIDVVPKSDMFISGAKDNTVRLWKINPTQKEVSCLAVGQGHTHSVSAVAVSRLAPKFFVSGSEDCTLKLWTIPDDLDTSVTKEIHALVTELAHQKTITSVAVAPNDKFIASGSMDKTAKRNLVAMATRNIAEVVMYWDPALWNAKDLSLIGVMRGHSRGVWSVEFSPIDRVLATSSGDGTVKLWSLTDFKCVRTFQGHECPVLKVKFICRGMQLLSSGSNGLVKLWTIKNNECLRTFKQHEDKIWAMAVSEAEDSFITGGEDSNLIVWMDVTEKEQIKAREKHERFYLHQQELSNLIHQKNYLKAIRLAIILDQPFKLLNIMKVILSDEAGESKLYETVERLKVYQTIALLKYAAQWNTNSKHCYEAQVMVSTVIKMYPPEKLKKLQITQHIEALLPYTERHFQRMTRLVQQSMFLEYTLQCMRGLSSEQAKTEPKAITERKVGTGDKNIDASSLESDEESAESSSESDPDETVESTTDENMNSKNLENKSKEAVIEEKQGTRRAENNETKLFSEMKENEKMIEGKKYTLLTGVFESDSLKANTEKNFSESSDESEDSESENENDVEHGKFKEIKKVGEHDSDSSSESDGDGDNDDDNTFSSAFSAKEVYRTSNNKASTGKRNENNSSLEESSESTDNSGAEDLELKSAESVRLGTHAMEVEESTSENDSDSDNEVETEVGIKKNLFKNYLSSKNKRKSSTREENEDNTSEVPKTRGQKRKITDAFTVVKKKTPKVVDKEFFVDRKGSRQRSNENSSIQKKNFSNKQRGQARRSDRLKKLKKPGRR